MYSAPAVSYPVGRSSFHGLLLIAVLAAGVTSLTLWTMQSDAPGVRHLAATALWLVSAAVAAWAWWRSPAGQLTWDGKAWTWTCGNASRQVACHVLLDSQNTLLLNLRTPGSPHLWIWPKRHLAPGRWLPLRRAVFARQAASLADDGWAAP